MSIVGLFWFIQLLFPFYSTKADCPTIFPRYAWNATSPIDVTFLEENPPPYIVVHHSATKSCYSNKDCIKLVKSIQNNHINENKWSDIGYNFLIGGDGSIYEGRGWGIQGAHCISYNRKSLGICLLGNFEDENPHNVQLKALEDLVSCAQETNKTTDNYHIIGHIQGSSTLCPGKYLYGIIKKWPHFENNPQ